MFMVWLMYRTHMIQYVSVLYSTALDDREVERKGYLLIPESKRNVEVPDLLQG